MSRFLRTKLRTKPWHLACVASLALSASGCIYPPLSQTTVGGQTLPSAYYLRDDVQYFPAGPEFVLTNEVRAHEEYRLQQQAIADGLAAPIAP